MSEHYPLLDKYLTERGLFEPGELVKAIAQGGKEVLIGQEILNDDEVLARVAGAWQSNYSAIEAVIKARIYAIVVEMVMSAYPQEVIVLRQSMVEIAKILEDFKKYNEEHLRREEAKNRK